MLENESDWEADICINNMKFPARKLLQFNCTYFCKAKIKNNDFVVVLVLELMAGIGPATASKTLPFAHFAVCKSFAFWQVFSLLKNPALCWAFSGPPFCGGR